MQLLGNSRLLLISQKVRCGKIAQQGREVHCLWLRHSGISKTDVHLDRNPRIFQKSRQCHPKATERVLFADQLGLHRLWSKAYPVIVHWEKAQSLKQRDELCRVRVVFFQQATISQKI